MLFRSKRRTLFFVLPRQYITLFRLCQVDFAILSDFLRTLRQFRRFRSAPNSQTLFLKNPTALGAPAYPLPAPFACSPSAFLSEKDLQAVRSTLPSRRRLQTLAHLQIPLPSRRRLQTLAHLQIPLRHGKPSHLSPSERLFYSAFLFGWRFANKTRLIFPFPQAQKPPRKL